MYDPTSIMNFRYHATNLPPVIESAPWMEEQYCCRLPLARAATRSSSMWNDNYERHDGPPTNRLWGDEDVAAYVGFRSVDELIARHPDFPAPVPLGLQGRRWRPSDVIDWIDQLCASTPNSPKAPQQKSNRVVVKAPGAVRPVPAFDLAMIAEQLKEASRG